MLKKSDTKNNVLTSKEHKVWNRRKNIKISFAATWFIVGAGGGILSTILIENSFNKVKTIDFVDLKCGDNLHDSIWHFNLSFDFAFDVNVTATLYINSYESNGEQMSDYIDVSLIHDVISFIYMGRHQQSPYLIPPVALYSYGNGGEGWSMQAWNYPELPPECSSVISLTNLENINLFRGAISVTLKH